jgi:hypothetical protein
MRIPSSLSDIEVYRPAKQKRPMAKSIPSESLLAALPTELSHNLFAEALTLSLAADQTLFWAGDEGDGCYRVDEGLLKASVAEPAGGERILAILGPGSVVGELSMVDGAPRSASVTALRDSKLSIAWRTRPLSNAKPRIKPEPPFANTPGAAPADVRDRVRPTPDYRRIDAPLPHRTPQG